MISIPKKIFQTHKSIEYIKSKPKVLSGIRSWKKWIPEFEYYFYTNEMCERFIFENFSQDIYEAYQKLPMAVMKADLWRYCVIYHYGGIYADADTICKVNPNMFINNKMLNIVAENDIHLCQWVFSAPPKSPILKKVIDLSVERILGCKEIKGEHIIHKLTGPGVFTDGIEKYLKEHGKPIFPKKYMYEKTHGIPEIHFFKHNIFHKLCVLHMFTGGDSDGWTHERKKLLM